MEIKKYNEKKIFVTGISGSGKTTFAKKYAKKFNIEYFDFDLNWSYKNPIKNEYEKLIEKYPNEFITDAIPYAHINNHLNFIDYYKENENNIKIICVCCTNKDEFDKRIDSKPFGNDKINSYLTYNLFYFHSVKNIYSNLNIEYFDSYINEFINEDELFDRINWISDNNLNPILKNCLRNYLNSQTYDKFYQDIECVDIIGYSKSFKTWENIKNLVEWKDKKVADLGCFHCYFSFKAAKEGACVTALDSNDDVLKTSQYINELEGNIINIKKWEGGEEISSDFDIALCLNVLHHFKDIPYGLKNIKSKIIIFEINMNLIDIISQEFNIINKIKSHRMDANNSHRIILLCSKKQ